MNKHTLGILRLKSDAISRQLKANDQYQTAYYDAFNSRSLFDVLTGRNHPENHPLVIKARICVQDAETHLYQINSQFRCHNHENSDMRGMSRKIGVLLDEKKTFLNKLREHLAKTDDKALLDRQNLWTEISTIYSKGKTAMDNKTTSGETA